MNDDDRLERLYRDGLHQLAPTRAPDRLRTTINSETGRVAPRPRWLALIREHPMRSNSRLTVGSPTWRVAVIIAATTLIAALVVGASFGGAQLFAKNGFIVDASGGGTHTSIGAAVAEAEEGFEIFVRPGTYEEAFELDKTLSIRGDGPVEEIIVTAPDDGPTVELTPSRETEPYAVSITAGDPVLAGMTFRGQPSELIVTGGSPTLEGLVFEDVGAIYTGGTSLAGNSVLAMGADAYMTVRASEIRRGGPIALFDDAAASITGNRLTDGPQIYLRGPVPGTVVSGNTVSGTARYALNVHDTSEVEITGNTFTDYGQTAIRVRDGGDGLVSGNEAEGGIYGISIDEAHGLEVSGNTVTDTQFGIVWKSGDGLLESNTVTGSRDGIVVGGGTPVVAGNVSCDNVNSNFEIADAADPDVRENEFCAEPEPAE